MTWFGEILNVEEKHQVKVQAFRGCIDSFNDAVNVYGFFKNMLLFYWKLYTLQLAELDALVLYNALALQQTKPGVTAYRVQAMRWALHTMQRHYRRYTGFQISKKRGNIRMGKEEK